MTLPLLTLIGSDKKHRFKQSDGFNTLMGADQSVWKFVGTREDYANLGFFKELYETDKDLRFVRKEQKKIPHVIDCILIVNLSLFSGLFFQYRSIGANRSITFDQGGRKKTEQQDPFKPDPDELLSRRDDD
ncbi:MAG: hypothetical protein AAGE99_05875 [Chlamydiota bacterium]